MEDFAAGVAIEALSGLVKFIQSIIKDYGSAADNAKILQSRSEEMSTLLEYYKRSNSSPIDRVIIDIILEVKEAEKTLDEFKEKIKKHKNTIKLPVYFVKRTYRTVDYSRQFMDHVEKMDQLQKRLEDGLRLTRELLEPSALAYAKDMKKKEYMDFWIEMCGPNIHCEKTSWPLFISKYQQKYEDPLDIDLIIRIKATALVEGDVLTLFGYMQLTNLCDLPLKRSKLPPLLDCNSTISQADLIKVSEIVSNLIKDFSSKEMSDYIVTVIEWYKGESKKEDVQKQAVGNSERVLGNYDNNGGDDEKKKKMEEKNNKTEEEEAKERQERADYCFRLVKEARLKKKEKLTDEDKHAIKVDEARRHVSFFYQRFMALCAIGQLSREVFKKVDFPGKTRMKSFIRDFMPLDHANYHIVINPKVKEWETKKPKVYKFLEEFIAEIKKDEKVENPENNENVVNVETVDGLGIGNN